MRERKRKEKPATFHAISNSYSAWQSRILILKMLFHDPSRFSQNLNNKNEKQSNDRDVSLALIAIFFRRMRGGLFPERKWRGKRVETTDDLSHVARAGGKLPK